MGPWLDYRRLVAQPAQRLRSTCEALWPEAVPQLQALQEAAGQFERALREAHDRPYPGERAYRAAIEMAADAFTGSLIPGLRHLDELLSGTDARGQALQPPRDEAVRGMLQQVRDRLFGYAAEHGGWAEYRPRTGDPEAAHRGKYEALGDAGHGGDSAVIENVVHPGYYQPGRTGGTVHPARVYLEGERP
jgi:hypothetical protein